MRFTLFLLLILPWHSFSQNEANIWYFGNKAGLNFNGGSPTALTNGQVNSFGGPASICDGTGQLLFYTNGMSIWNRNHTVMPNGAGLSGNASATQAALIIKMPGSGNLYYVFTNDKFDGSNGLCYSVVDMNLASGFGDVTGVKNVSLLASSTEKLTACQHGNGTSVWVVAHLKNSNSFHAYLLSSSGLSTTPVVSNVGISHSGTNTNQDVAQGVMKASPDGTKLSIATSAGNNTLEIFDFNKVTGEVTNPLTLSGLGPYPFGLEYSPDGTRMYLTLSDPNNLANNKLIQFNLQAGSPSAILSSATEIASNLDQVIGALQVGTDSKIYVAKNNTSSLGVIQNPNNLGLSCNFDAIGVSLGIKTSRRGLPNFLTSYFNHPRFTYLHTCLGEATQFFVSDLTGVSAVVWNFGDPASGTQNSSSQNSPTHIFSAPGTFQVRLIRVFSNTSDTVIQPVIIHPLPAINLGPQSATLCQGTDTLLNAGDGFVAYQWQNGSASQTQVVSAGGLFSVTVTDDFGCNNSDFVNFSLIEDPVFSLGPDTVICQSIPLQLSAFFPGASYLWSNGNESSSLQVTAAGTYAVTVSNRCGQAQDQILIGVIPSVTVHLGPDTAVCQGGSVILDPGPLSGSFLWSTGATTPTLEVNQTGSYILSVTDQCGTVADTVVFSVLDLPVVNVQGDTVFCLGNLLNLSASGNFVTDYLWSDGQTTQTASFGQTGTIWVQGSNICGADSDSIAITGQAPPQIQLGPDTTIYDDESYTFNLPFQSAWTYAWTPGYALNDSTIHNPVSTPEQSVSYYVVVTNEFGCTATDLINLTVLDRPLPQLTFYNTFTPNEDGTNDTWVIDNVDEYPQNRLRIYDRLGIEVYRADAYLNQWDGKWKKKDLPEATYFYIFEPGEGLPAVHGNVTIIR